MKGTRKDSIETLAVRFIINAPDDDRMRVWRAMVSRFGPTATKQAINSMEDTYELLHSN
jgi:hypothetical protein